MEIETETHAYGYIPDDVDNRDHKIKFTLGHAQKFHELNNLSLSQTLPSTFNLSSIINIPDAANDINQGSLGSCTANAISFAYLVDEAKQKNSEIFMPSRLFIYYNERAMEGTIDEDAGAQIRDGIKSINQYGVCSEHLWIYDPTKFAETPPSNIYIEAKKAIALKYQSIDFSDDTNQDARTQHLKLAILSGYPIIFGFMVYDSFESEQVTNTGIMPMPNFDTESIIGGHAVCITGYDDSKNAFLVKNSWGRNWGINSYFYMPYDYFTNDLTSDFWILQSVSNPTNITGYDTSYVEPDAENIYATPSSGGVVND